MNCSTEFIHSVGRSVTPLRCIILLLLFLQIRGSVPVFWSQPGYKYRPPPKLDKGETPNFKGSDRIFHLFKYRVQYEIAGYNHHINIYTSSNEISGCICFQKKKKKMPVLLLILLLVRVNPIFHIQYKESKSDTKDIDKIIVELPIPSN